MIYIVYSGPCKWDPKQRGFAEAEVGYIGEDPLKTATQYLRQIPGALLYSVMKDGVIYA